MTCDTYFSTDVRCPLNTHAIWNAGHYCGLAPGHEDDHVCACRAKKARGK